LRRLPRNLKTYHPMNRPGRPGRGKKEKERKRRAADSWGQLNRRFSWGAVTKRRENRERGERVPYQKEKKEGKKEEVEIAALPEFIGQKKYNIKKKGKGGKGSAAGGRSGASGKINKRGIGKKG